MTIDINKAKEYLFRYVQFVEPVEEGEEEWCNNKVKRIEEGKNIVDYKSVYNENIYSVVLDDSSVHYIGVLFHRDNNGYWGVDGERYDPEVYEVKPVTKTITAYEPI